jgi:hypothetical protein
MYTIASKWPLFQNAKTEVVFYSTTVVHELERAVADGFELDVHVLIPHVWVMRLSDLAIP